MLRSFYKILFLSALLLNFVNMSFAMSGGIEEKALPTKVPENQLPKDGYVSSFDISPDGQEIVFAVNYECPLNVYLKSDIWKMAIDGTNLRRLTYTGEDPVNKKAVAISKQGYKVRDAAPYRTVGADRSEFSGKGNFILYNLKRTDYFMGEKRSDQPMIMNRDGSQQRKINRRIFSPDETKYALFAESDSTLRQYTLAIFDAKTDKILAEIPNIYETGFIDIRLQKRIFWSPDSTTIAFTGCKEPEDPKRNHIPPIYLWLVDVKGENLREVTWGSSIGGLQWSPKGKRFVASIGNKEIVDTRDQTQLIKEGKTPEERFPHLIEHSGMWVYDVGFLQNYHIAKALFTGNVQWSPDAKRLLFVSGGLKEAYLKQREEPAVKGLYLSSADGINLTQIIGNVNPKHFEWAPDGHHILYSTVNPAFQIGDDLWLLSIDGTVNKKVATDLKDTYPAGYQWLKNKTGFIYLSSDNLRFMDRETLTARKLTNLTRDDK